MKFRGTLVLLAISFFAAFFTFIYFTNTITAEDIGRYDFNDGIDKWNHPSNIINQVGELPIKDNLKLGYAFGLAQNTSGKVSTGGDDTIEKNSISTGDLSSYSKMNIFLNDNNDYISAIFQSGFSNTNSNKEGVSQTSPDFMIAPSTSNTAKGITSAAFSVLGNPGTLNGSGNTGLSSKKYFWGKDKNGNPAYKIMGYFDRKNNSGFQNGNYHFEVELLLRASPTHSAMVQREMFVKNLDNKPAEFVTLFGEDTKIGEDTSGDDSVAVKDLGNKKGIYIEDLNNGKYYRLMVSNQTIDGFDSYNGQARVSNWASGLTNGLVTGSGAETHNNPKGTQLTGVVDSAYILKWNSRTLAPNQVAHFSSAMGVNKRNYSIPTPSKTYINETRRDGTNRIGDKLKFTLQLTNNGYDSQWNAQEVIDHIPNGLQIDPNSITQTSNTFLNSQPSPTDYDSTTRTLTVPTPYKLTDGKSETVTFEATLTSDALQNLDGNLNFTNTAYFLGSDAEVSSNITDTFKASTSFPVLTSGFKYTFQTKIKNITNNEDYRESTTAKIGDRIGYQTIYKVDPDSHFDLVRADNIDDKLPDGLLLDSKSIKTQGVDGKWYDQTWGIHTGAVNTIKPGQQITTQFEVNVSASSIGTISNNAFITKVETNEPFDFNLKNTTYDEQIATAAILNIQKMNSFIDTPKTIDFGSIKMQGKPVTLNNINTDGELIVSHPDSNNFKVNICYDNDNPHTHMFNSNGETIPTSDSDLLFIKQRNNSFEDIGTWQPILPGGTPIQTAPFKGNQQSLNLTKYVGTNDWKIKLASNTPSGLYKGTLTWGLTESV